MDLSGNYSFYSLKLILISQHIKDNIFFPFYTVQFILCRFLDINHGKKLHLWRSKSNESTFPSLVSCICASSSAGGQAKGGDAFPSWIAAGLSSGNCILFDARSGNIIASWQAHDGYVTKVY